MDQNDVKVSFAITTHNETECLRKLLNQLNSIKVILDEIVIVDDFSTNEETKAILDEAAKNGARVFQNALNGDFAQHKNFLTSKCKNDYIFNIDADELICEKFKTNFREIVATNPDVEQFKLPRINKVEGLTLEHTQKWGWKLSGLASEIEEKSLTPDSNEYKLLKAFNLVISETNGNIKFYTPIVNWPDFQGRIYKKNDSIRWQNKVHEVLVGHKKFANCPVNKDFALLHNKVIAVQEKQNELYQNLAKG